MLLLTQRAGMTGNGRPTNSKGRASTRHAADTAITPRYSYNTPGQQLVRVTFLFSRYVFATGAYYFGPWSENKMHGDGGCFVDAKGRKCAPHFIAF